MAELGEVMTNLGRSKPSLVSTSYSGQHHTHGEHVAGGAAGHHGGAGY